MDVKIEMTNRAQTEDEDDDVKEDSKNFENVEWDYVLMFGNLDPPQDKGNNLPEDHPKMKRFRENEKKRRQLVKRLKNPNIGLIVTRKRSSDGKAIFVLVSATQERLEKQAELTELPVKLLPEYGGGYAPYEVEDKKMFVGHDKEFGFFRKNIRHYLIKTIMEGDAVYGGADINVGRLVKAGVITKIFPLHTEPDRANLLENWASPKAILKYQPLEEVRDYYGEELGFYFAWLGFYTSWLWGASLVGMICFILYMVNKGPGSTYGVWVITGYSVFLAFWATFFLEFWKRKNNTLAFRWGMNDFVESEQARPDYFGEPKDGVYAKGHWLPLDPNRDYGFPLPKKTKYYPSNHRNAKIGAGLPVLITMLVSVVVGTVAVLSLRLFLQNSGIGFWGSLIGGVANAITISIMNFVWKLVAEKLTNWENHRTQTEYDNALIFKIFVFYFVNSYTSLYYIAFFKSDTRFWGSTNKDLKDGCKYGDPSANDLISWGCVDELTFQLATILGTNMIVGQTKEVLLPYVMSKIQLMRFLKSTGETKQNVVPWEADSKLADYQGTFDEYSEMVIQYGYITLFASAFPLAPLMAVVNNLIEIRTDAFKLLSSTKRPEYKGAANIGNWYGVLEVIGFIAVITNCLLIGFSFDAISKNFSDFNRRFYVLAIIVCMEHAIIAIKLGIATLVPDVPGAIMKEMIFHDFCKEQLIKKMTGAKKETVEFEGGKDDLNDVDALIAANEEQQMNPLGLNLLNQSKQN